jgi:hypothetical protein
MFHAQTTSFPFLLVASLALSGLAAMAQSQSPGLSPPGTYTIAEATIDNFTTVQGVPVDVKVYRPLGLPAGAAPVLLYGPGGGSGTSGQIAAVPQHDLLWRRLASSGLTVVFLQNEQETAPGANFWQLRGAVVQWALANSSTLNAAFGTQLDNASPVVVAGWSLGAATVVQHVGADFGFGDSSDARVRGAVLFANPAIGAYGGVITSNGLAQVDKPVLAIFGTDDMGQPGSYTPGSPPASSPRGLGVQAMLGGASPFVFGVCFTDANHFEYGAQPAAAGSANAARIEVINGHVQAFVDLVLRGLPDCGPFTGPSWPGPNVAWSAQRCTPPIVAVVGQGCATSAGIPLVGASGGAPRAGKASAGGQCAAHRRAALRARRADRWCAGVRAAARGTGAVLVRCRRRPRLRRDRAAAADRPAGRRAAARLPARRIRLRARAVRRSAAAVRHLASTAGGRRQLTPGGAATRPTAGDPPECA